MSVREALIAAREALAGGYQSRTTDEVLAKLKRPNVGAKRGGTVLRDDSA